MIVFPENLLLASLFPCVYNNNFFILVIIIMNCCCVYDFRMNGQSLSYLDVISNLKGIAKKYSFQREEGDSGYNHFQGRLSLYKKRRKMEALRLFEIQPNYFEPTVKSEYLKGEGFYCLKEDTRIEGPWTEKDKPKFVPRHIAGRTPYAWQQKVIDSKEVYDERRINCIIDPSGNSGKSILASFVRNRGGITLPPIGDCKDLISAMCDILIGKQERNPGLITVDIPRSINNKRLYMLFTAIETIKDGYIQDFRYKFRDWEYNRPQIWIFTNNDIETKYLSKDRFIFWRFNDDGDLSQEE